MVERLHDVTLYVPARNAAAWLAACAEAIARLDPAPKEVLVIYDERSRDETVAIARALPDVHAIPQPRPGLTAARNAAYQLAQPRWVASIDSDVLVAPDWLGALWQARTDLGEPAALSGRTEERIRHAGDAFRALMMPHHWGAHVMRGPFMTISDALFDRDAVLAVGGYRESLERYGDDSRLSQDLRDAGYALAYTPHARGLHIRTDTIASVLDLRWAYSEPRQRARLMDLDGLKAKLAVNVEYGRMAAARALEAGEPTLAWIGALLPWHHALKDCEAMLSQRTLLNDDTRTIALSVLRRGLWDALVASARGVATVAAAALSQVTPSGTHATMPWPAFGSYVKAVTTACVAWAHEVAGVLAPIDPQALIDANAETIARWAHAFGGPSDARTPGSRWPAPRSAAPWRDAARSEASRPMPVRPPSAVPRTRVIDGQTVTAVALDTFADPRAALRDVVQGARAVGLSYTMPTRLEAGAPILLAVDLAEACAAEGLAISGFETLAGGVELWAQRIAR